MEIPGDLIGLLCAGVFDSSLCRGVTQCAFLFLSSCGFVDDLIELRHRTIAPAIAISSATICASVIGNPFLTGAELEPMRKIS